MTNISKALAAGYIAVLLASTSAFSQSVGPGPSVVGDPIVEAPAALPAPAAGAPAPVAFAPVTFTGAPVDPNANCLIQHPPVVSEREDLMTFTLSALTGGAKYTGPVKLIVTAERSRALTSALVQRVAWCKNPGVAEPAPRKLRYELQAIDGVIKLPIKRGVGFHARFIVPGDQIDIWIPGATTAMVVAALKSPR